MITLIATKKIYVKKFANGTTKLKKLKSFDFLKLWPLFLVYFFIRFRSFLAKNVGSIGERAAKLLTIKL